MGKQLSTDLTYDAPRAAVVAMLTDPAFRERVLDAQHALSRTVTVEGATVSMIYTLAVRNGVPSVARKFVGDTIEVHHRERWDAGFTRGDLAVRLPGKPGELTGTATLAERGGKTVEAIILTASVSLPLIAGKMEELVLGVFRDALRKEHQVGTAWLNGK